MLGAAFAGRECEVIASAWLFLMSVAIGVRVPGTRVEIVLVLKSMLMDVSL